MAFLNSTIRLRKLILKFTLSSFSELDILVDRTLQTICLAPETNVTDTSYTVNCFKVYTRADE